jgi:hypothetical protein
MTKKVTYTSTLPEDVMETVNDYSEKNNISKNKVVENALRQFFFGIKQNDFREGFKRAANDIEMRLIAEEGMDDYSEILQQNEKKRK